MTERGIGARRADRRRLLLAFSALSALVVAGCAGPARETFDLAAAVGSTRAASRSAAAVAVREPLAAAPTGSDRVVVRDVDGSVSVLPGVQWSERLPRLFQMRLIDSLQQAGVAASEFGAGSSRAIATDIRRFEIDVARNEAVVEIVVRIMDDSGAARAMQSFHAETPAPEHTGPSAVQALTESAAQVLPRVAAWAHGAL